MRREPSSSRLRSRLSSAVKHFWMVLSGVGIVIAGIFLWRREFDRAFIAAALGMVAWFLNYRAQMRAITAAAEDEANERNKGDEDDDED